MPKTLQFALAAMLIMYASGCKKAWDYQHQHPGDEYTYCDFKKFKVWYNDTYNEFDVSYNKKGQPVSVLAKYPDPNQIYQNQEQHFRYDKNGKLTDWITNSQGSNNVYVWDVYHYLTPKKILDTSFSGEHTGSLITDAHPPIQDGTVTMRVRLFDLDQYDRIIKITDVVNNFVYEQHYGPDGNTTDYDDFNFKFDSAVNALRTNKIWMLVNNNFNTNNYTRTSYGGNALTYNSYMLPTSMTLIPDNGLTSQQYMTCFISQRLEIVYDCSGLPKGY